MPMIRYVPRAGWKAVPPKYREPMDLPVFLVILHSTRTKPCFTKEDCIKAVQDIQRKHIMLGLPDVLYNFLIGGDGYIYEGRGWETIATKHPNTHFNGKALDVAYIGKYKIPEEKPPQIMQDALKNLTNLGIVKEALEENFLRSDINFGGDDKKENEENKDDDKDFDLDNLDEKDFKPEELEELRQYVNEINKGDGKAKAPGDSEEVDLNDFVLHESEMDEACIDDSELASSELDSE